MDKNTPGVPRSEKVLREKMKKYRPLSAYYRELIHACRQELKALGYAKGTVKLSGLGEFLRRMEMTGKTEVERITKSDVKMHYAYLLERSSKRGAVLSGHTVPGYFFSLRLFFDYAERNGLIKTNPMTGLKFRRPKGGRTLTCSPAEISQLYAACSDDRQRAILHLLYGCGLRRMEAEALNLADLNYPAALLYVRRGKGKKRRVIPLTSKLVNDLKRYAYHERLYWLTNRSPNAYLLDDNGNRMRGGTIHRRLKELVEKAELNPSVSAHTLRHSIATHLLSGGMSVEKVRDFLGHESIDTTQLYTHIKTEEL
jgi:integrase/recombinase XerD